MYFTIPAYRSIWCNARFVGIGHSSDSSSILYNTFEHSHTHSTEKKHFVQKQPCFGQRKSRDTVNENTDV